MTRAVVEVRRKTIRIINETIARFPGFLITLVTLIIVAGAIYYFWETLESSHEAIRSIGLVCAAIISLPLLLWRGFINNQMAQAAQDQSDNAQKSLVADTYARAIESLGAEAKDNSPNLELRLGALYALEKIAQENKDYHPQIMEVLCAYVRLRTKSTDTDESTDTENGERLIDDVQTALTIIGRRNTVFDDASKLLNLQQTVLVKANLSKANLSKVNLRRADLRGAKLRGADLMGAVLSATILREAVLMGADLRGADLMGAKLRGAGLREAVLRKADLRLADLRGAYLMEADLRGADLRGADLRGANLMGAKLSKANLSGAKLSGANLWEANLTMAKELTCKQLKEASNWERAFRDESLACGKSIP